MDQIAEESESGSSDSGQTLFWGWSDPPKLESMWSSIRESSTRRIGLQREENFTNSPPES